MNIRNYEPVKAFVEQLKSGRLTYLDGQLYRGNVLVKGFKTGKGQYLGMNINLDGKKTRALVHRIIYAYFHGIEELKKHETIDHIDGDKYNNRIENLQGISVRENNMKANPNMLEIEQVLEIRERLNKGESTVNLGKEFGVSTTTISKIKRGTRYRNI